MPAAPAPHTTTVSGPSRINRPSSRGRVSETRLNDTRVTLAGDEGGDVLDRLEVLRSQVAILDLDVVLALEGDQHPQYLQRVEDREQVVVAERLGGFLGQE